MSLAATIPWSDYEKLPQDQRSRPLTDEEYKRLTPSQLEVGGLADREEGAPADFNGPVFPNPDHIRPQWDTEPSIPVTRLPVGVSFKGGVYRGDAQVHEVGAKMSPQTATPPLPKGYTLDEAGATPPLPKGYTLDSSTGKAAKTDEPGFLDREIPLDSYTHATESGLQSIGRGFRSAGRGLYEMFRPPESRTEETIGAISPGALPVYRTLRGIGETAKSATEIPAAIRDINASPDPLGTYAKAGQETAGQGAGQALVALGTEGIAKGVAPVARAAKPIVGRALTTASDAVDPDLVGIASPRLAHVQRVAGRVGKAFTKGTEEAPIAPAPDYERFAPNTGGAPPTELPTAPARKIPYGEPNPAPKGIAKPEPDLTGLNKPFAGGLDEPKPGKILDATGENKAYAGGMDEYTPPKAKLGNTGNVPTPSETAQQIRYFRSRNLGEEGIPHHPESHAQATASLPEAEDRIAPYREQTEGTPQEIITGNLAETPAFSVRPGPNGPNWYTFHGDVPESAVTRIARPAEVQAEPIGPAEAPQTSDPVLQRLRQHAQAIREEQTAEVPAPEQDLTDIGTRSVARAKAMRGVGEPTEVTPAETEDEFKARLARKADEMRARGLQPNVARPE